MKGYNPLYGKLAVLGIFLAFGLMLWYLILPYITGVMEKVQLKNELTEQVAFSNNWEENYNQLAKYRLELEEGIQTLNRNRLDTDEAYLLIDAIYEFSETEIVQILRVDPQDISKTDDKVSQNIVVEFNGRYHSTASFINSLENSGYPLVIQEIEISRISNTELIAELTINVKFSEE
jgi:Tfp pilus assembly protein PilO